MSTLLVVKALLIAAVLVLFLASVGTIHCRIGGDAVEVLILGRVVRRVRFEDIAEVHRRGALLHESWSGPRIWNSVTIRRRSGILKNFVVTPDDPDRFVDRLRALVPYAGAGFEASPPRSSGPGSAG